MKDAAAAPQVLAAGVASLLVELTVIRYLPGQIRVLGYFTNFVLLAAFVGLGVGMLGVRRWRRAERLGWSAPLAVAALVALARLGRTLRVLASGEEVLFLEYQTKALAVPLYPFLGVAFVLIALAFVPIGLWVGQTLAGPRPLRRYALNIAGSLIGIGVFAVLSASGAAPWLWLTLAGASLLPGVVAAPWSYRIGGVAAVLVAVVLGWQATHDATWSPYQKITTAPLRLHPKRGIVQEWSVPDLSERERATIVTLPPARGFTVRVNDDSYQTPLDLGDAALKEFPSLAPMRVQYDLPYSARPPGRVLVLGAGTGNDVAAALRAGATRVDAVEIDPEILALGRRHPERPYDDPRVRAHLTDARSFLARTAERFDTIVYGMLDSHVLLSSMSNVRLDSYVFTVESFTLARSRLAEDGILVVSHAVGTPWFVQHMTATLTQAFERPPLLVSESVAHPLGYVYAAGDLVPSGKPAPPGTIALTDDWPFVYLRDRTIPREYLIAMALMAVASALLVRLGTGARFRGFDVHFFALGAGFLLVETRGLGVLALLVGSTWAVTSAVFAGVLIMALASTVLTARLGGAMLSAKVVRLMYALLAAFLALQFVIDIGDVAELPLVGRAVVGVALVSLPMLASGVVFASSLARTGDADRALASNLVGAVAGGLVEYLSTMIGFRMLVLVAALFYALSFVSSRRAAAAASAPG
ncbi:MAG: methyltransferase domain-containing protein [Labilithrix sp.]|nr:methyltransferase domain-containing protein [Labilithrix sp.]